MRPKWVGAYPSGMDETEPPVGRVPTYLSLPDVADRLGVDRKTLRRWAADGVNGCPPAVRLGDRSLFFREDAVLLWLESRERGQSDG